MMKREMPILATILVATLVAGNGVAVAAVTACPPGTTQIDPCIGTAKTKKTSGNDIIEGTAGVDYIVALSGNDRITGAGGNDTTDGGKGNDVYSFRNGFGDDALIDAAGIDTVNLSLIDAGADISLIPEWAAFGYNRVYQPSTTDSATIFPGTVIEKAVGTSGDDHIYGGKENNTLRPGPGGIFNTDALIDWGGCAVDQCLVGNGQALPASNDIFKDIGAGLVYVEDYGGSKDILDLSEYDSEAAHFELDGDTLIIYNGSVVNQIQILNYLDPQFRIERIVFADTTITNVAQAQAMVAASRSRAGVRGN
jgi:Ca2+-binding RTX toxin-like protein